jgi:uncharacterized membrane protein
MIQAHVLDAWTAPTARSANAFRHLTVLGGFAAPLFLFLAGAGLMIAAGRAAPGATWRTAAAAGVRRGLLIFVLAFLFRLQALIVSPGGPLLALFRVDILNIMGLTMAAVAMLCVAAGNRRRAIVWCAAAAVVIAAATPAVRAAAWVDRLPIWLQWHLRPAGEHTTFTLLPWAAFPFAGAAWGGAASCTWTGRSAEARGQIWTTAAAALVTVLGFVAASRPSYASASFWTTSPAFFTIRVGIVLGLVAALQAIDRLLPARVRGFDVLQQFGRESLFIYWIHVELVYGYATWALHGRLAVWQAVAGCGVMSALLFAAIPLRRRLTNKWRNRRILETGPRPATI